MEGDNHMKTVAVLLADGFEETEALAPADILVRSGIQVQLVAACAGKNEGEPVVVTGSHGFGVQCTTTLRNLIETGSFPDGVFCPGGLPGATNLGDDGFVRTFIEKMYAAGRLVSAICAAPAVVLGHTSVLNGKKFTCYPDMENQVAAGCTGEWCDDRVVVDGNLITSRGPGTAMEFGYAVAEYFNGAGSCDQLKKGMLFK